MKIARDLALQLLETNFENICAKLKAGGTLTKQEKDELAKSASTSPEAPPTAAAPAPAAPPSPSDKPLGPSDIARDWTAQGWPATRQYASRCITKLGCPTTSLEAARTWRASHTSVRRRSDGTDSTNTTAAHSASSTTANTGTPPSAQSAEILGDSLDATLARAREAEREQYRLYRDAVTAKDATAQSLALRNHGAAQKNLIEIEQQVFAAKTERGEFVSMPEAKRRIDSRLNQLRAAMTSFPRVLALELAPADAQRVEAKIKTLQASHFSAPIANAEKPLGVADPAEPAASAA